MQTLRALALAAVALLAACGSSGPSLTDQVAPVACGMCIFKMPEAKGCVWAIEIEGEHYLVQSGQLPKDHMQHAPDGMCNMTRQARVTGQVEGERFVASQFELLPAQADSVPAAPTFTEEGVH